LIADPVGQAAMFNALPAALQGSILQAQAHGPSILPAPHRAATLDPVAQALRAHGLVLAQDLVDHLVQVSLAHAPVGLHQPARLLVHSVLLPEVVADARSIPRRRKVR